MARDKDSKLDKPKMRIRLINSREGKSRQYSTPTSSEVAALIVGDGG